MGSKDKQSIGDLNRAVFEITGISLRYISLFIILIFFAKFLSNNMLAILIPIVITLISAFISCNFGSTNTRSHKILNYYPIWFLASLATFFLLLISDIGIIEIINSKFIIGGSIVLHFALGIYAMGHAEYLLNEE